MKIIYSVIEKVYLIMYFLVAVIAALILYPISFIFKKDHHEESGYDL